MAADSRALADEVRAAAAELTVAGVGSPRNDAQLLAAFVLGLSPAELLRDMVMGDVTFTPAQHDRFGDLIARRTRRVPLQHLTGVAPFRRLELAVGPGVFIPRPETELLVGWGIERLRSAGRSVSARAVDLCAGSGAIALAVATEFVGARVYAVEREPEALVWLRRNVAAVRPADGTGIDVVAGDATDALTLAELDGTVDLVLSNPPYVASDEVVDVEGARFDPPTAVWAADDGLRVIVGVVARAGGLLRPGGVFGVEHGENQGEKVRELLRPDVWTDVVTHPDLTGRERFTTAQRALGPLHRSRP